MSTRRATTTALVALPIIGGGLGLTILDRDGDGGEAGRDAAVAGLTGVQGTPPKPKPLPPRIRRKLNKIAKCESGGRPKAIGGGGLYRGKYQFDRSTWKSNGGRGDPAKAPEAEQDRIAARLYRARGSSPWPNCG